MNGGFIGDDPNEIETNMTVQATRPEGRALRNVRADRVFGAVLAKTHDQPRAIGANGGQLSLGGRSVRSPERPSNMSARATMRTLTGSCAPSGSMVGAANAAWQAMVQQPSESDPDR